MTINRPMLEEYLDAQLAPSQVALIDQELRTNPVAAQQLTRLRHERALRWAALKSFEPGATEASGLASRWLAEFKDVEMAPIARIGPRNWLQWSGAIAAALALLIGGFVVGRTSVGPATTPVATLNHYFGPNASGDLAEYNSVEELKGAWDKYVAALPQQAGTVQVADADSDSIPVHGNF